MEEEKEEKEEARALLSLRAEVCRASPVVLGLSYWRRTLSALSSQSAPSSIRTAISFRGCLSR